MDETLTLLSPEPKRMVTKRSRKSLREVTAMCPEGTRKSQESFTVSVSTCHMLMGDTLTFCFHLAWRTAFLAHEKHVRSSE